MLLTERGRAVRHVREVRPGGTDAVRRLADARSRGASRRTRGPLGRRGRAGPSGTVRDAPAARDGPVQGEGYDHARRMLRTGPPWMHRTGPLATANVNENFVHHEDVRRASGEGPRVLDDEMDAILWKMLGFGARLATPQGQGRRAHAAHARRPRAGGVDRRAAGRSFTGAPGELTLVHGRPQGGRRGHARGRPRGASRSCSPPTSASNSRRPSQYVTRSIATNPSRS